MPSTDNVMERDVKREVSTRPGPGIPYDTAVSPLPSPDMPDEPLVAGPPPTSALQCHAGEGLSPRPAPATDTSPSSDRRGDDVLPGDAADERAPRAEDPSTSCSTKPARRRGWEPILRI